MDKRKRKKRKITLKFKGVLLFVCIMIGFSLAFLSILNNQKTSQTKKNFYEYGITKRKAILYNEKYKVIGSIKKDIPVELETTNHQNYVHIKNTPYYLSYEDIKKGEKEEKIESHYLPSNKNITSNKKVILWKDNKKKVTLKEGLDLPILYETEEKYAVLFQNQILELNKSSSLKEKDHENTKEQETSHISVFYYEEINSTCDHENCTTLDALKEEINALKENGYYTITKEEYTSYLNHYLHLKEKAIYLTTTTKEEITSPLENELGITINTIENREPLKYFSTNKTTNQDTTKEFVDRYQIKNTTSIENLLKMAEGQEVKEPTNENQKIPVLNYHFLYSDGEDCRESICLNTDIFREHLTYLKDNNYTTLTIDEFKRWMYGEIELPTRSVLITFDDGAKGTGKHNGNKLIPMIEEFNMNATLFLIAGWWSIDNYQSPNLDIQSHTYDMHSYGSCGRGQINCGTYEEAVNDLQKSIDIIGNTDSFCFPFYYTSDTAIQAIKDVGFKMAFVGGRRKASRKDNKYLIPRYPILSDITMDQFISIVQ